MMSRSKRLIGAAALLISAIGTPAHAEQPAMPDRERTGMPVVLAGPGARSSNYATPLVIVQPGDDVTFMNLDLFPHSVRSKVMGPDNVPWCKPADPDEPRHRIRNPRRFPIGKCPLLWTPPISMTNGVMESKLYGTKNLYAGSTVDFYCTVFPKMKGTVFAP
jgi:plastocyanin